MASMKKVIIGIVLKRALAIPIGMYFMAPKYMSTVTELAIALFSNALNADLYHFILYLFDT